MSWEDYSRDPKMAGYGARSVYYFPDRGVIVRRKAGWYAANDTRWELVGVLPNGQLCQPASGPHLNRDEAAKTIGAIP